MISYDEAFNIIHAIEVPHPSEFVPLIEASGRITKNDIISPISVPTFCNSAMDGYAIYSELTVSATPSDPITLPVMASVFAGDNSIAADKLYAVKIMTGAAIPEPYDAVIIVENAHLSNTNELIISAPVTKNTNIRHIGEDFKCGEILLHAEETIYPEHIMLLASAGIDRVEVLERPKIVILSTGDEICDVGTPLKTQSSLYNASAPYLCAKAASLGLDFTYNGIVGDDKNALTQCFAQLQPNTVCITTGSVSMGDKDLIPNVLQELGAEILFHKVAIKPGKPILMARLANKAIVFALPGNPVSTAVGWQMFVLPFLRYSCAMAPELPTMVRLAHDYRKRGDLTLFLKAHLSLGQNMELMANIDAAQQSFKTKSFAQSDAFIRLDPGQLELRVNDPLACYPFNH